MDQLVNPGPDDKSLLYLQESHISEYIWRGEERQNLENVGSCYGISQWKLNERQKQLVRDAGFGFCLDASNVVKTDVNLLNALFERWRPETNSFHMPVGECTVTLEDVKFILGLPITGLPVTNQLLKERQKHHFKKILNMDEIMKDAMDAAGIRLTYLRVLFAKPKSGTLTEEEENIAVIAFLLDCIGTVILPNKSKCHVHAKYVSLLEDVKKVGQFSWGSACLANTYRQLRNATMEFGAVSFCGCHCLLQIWAWERISIGRAIPREKSEYVLPRVQAYRYSKKEQYKKRRSNKIPHHVPITVFRGEFDRFWDYHLFVWDPYERFFKLEDNRDFIRWRELARSRVPLIHFQCVEYQLPERVMRQFSLEPAVPRNPPRFDEFRAPKENKFQRIDAFSKYASEIDCWQQVGVDGHVQPVTNVHGKSCDIDTYMHWYRKVTRRRIHPVIWGGVPTGLYEPRSVFLESQAFILIEQAAQILRTWLPLVHRFRPDLVPLGETWFQYYTQHMQTWSSPNFEVELEKTFTESEMQSQPTDSYPFPTQSASEVTDLLTPDVQCAQADCDRFESQELPSVPIKKRRVQKMYDDDVYRPKFDSQPSSFDQCVDDTESQHLKQLGYEQDGGDMYRPVPVAVRAWIDRHLFYAPKDKDFDTFKIRGEGQVSIKTLKTLRPKEEIYDHIITGYIALLRLREDKCIRKKHYWFTDTWFMQFMERDWQKFKDFRGGKDQSKVFKHSSEVDVKLDDVPITPQHQYLLIPWLHQGVGGNHYTLLMLNLKSMGLGIIDSLRTNEDETKEMYETQTDIVYEYLPYVMRSKFGIRLRDVPKSKRKILLIKKSPKQRNGVDCGIYVLKVIDAFLQGATSLPPFWSQEVVDGFRYWIAWELCNDKARG